MGFDETTLRKAEELEKTRKKELSAKRERILKEMHLRDYDKLPTIDSSQSWIDKILRKLGLQRIR